MSAADYVIRVLSSPLEVDAAQWNTLLAHQSHATPFMRHEYLAALHASGSASPATGWSPRFITLWQRSGADTPVSQGSDDTLVAACALYLKDHSYGEYVFDWAWANAYAQHGMAYYPKALVAVPFTPVPGTRLLARDAATRETLAKTLIAWSEGEGLSSLHLLFASDEDVAACTSAGLLLRHTVQFHWKNVAPTLGTGVSSLPPEGVDFPGGGPAENLAPTLGTGMSSLPHEGVDFPGGGPAENLAPTLGTGMSSLPHEGVDFPGGGPAGNLALGLSTAGLRAQAVMKPFRDFDDFLASLSQDKRKKIRQERRKVAQAGVRFRWSLGRDISPQDWDFFYQCYERTYLEHGNAPYLSRDFFTRMAETMPENWLLFVAERDTDGRPHPIATSLIAISAYRERADGQFGHKNQTTPSDRVAYGRYWGALERVDCLHFEACYYQPLQWCIEHGYQRFEGGAQGEHKMARALLPVKTTSAHWLAHPDFADAVERFLHREGEGISGYLDELSDRSPFRQTR
ncbi:MAG: GNAT family N-acetyltransferase [Gammaproteobacteria bacterium]|nr:GNAT family N-acetyltransferase [Gammaproteobacteria bacterium]MBU0786039.1 GNAT family N-acetyltransferase [Gammaproteobacteria bacterium]MBU1786783.1 GNAT family N-acetyltransferase [Gammaproteobacteria bacterium]